MTSGVHPLRSSARLWLVAVLGFALGVPGAVAQNTERIIPDPTGVQDEAPPAEYHGSLYTREEVMIPVRDGVGLHTVIYRPQGSAKAGPALPFLMQRTPYGVGTMTARAIESGKPELAASGYVFVYQDIRGRYGSGGQFVMNRPVVAHRSKADVDETTDTRDTIDWLLAHEPNNAGKVGVLGISYPGFLAIMAGIDAHTAVKAISPQAPMTDVWLGDDFFHNGAFRQTYAFDYVQELEAQKTDVRADAKEDQYAFFLREGNFAKALASVGASQLPTAQRFLHEPTYTRFWQDMAVQRRLGRPEVPTLEVGGYWDQEDMWGPQAEYAVLHAHEARNDPQHRVFLVLGPWNHGGWARGPGNELTSHYGGISFGDQNTGVYFRTNFEAPFFEHYLKGRPGFGLDDTASFRTGENHWHQYAAWPPTDGYRPVNVYLASEGLLTAKEPRGAEVAEVTSYVADPANPVPYRHLPIESTYGKSSQWRTWLVQDQRFVSGRKDLANFTSPVLARNVTATGDVQADLFAATTGTDGDWVTKLIDIAPDGYELMVAEEILRGRYRNGFTTAEPVRAGEVNEYKWSLHGVDHTFLTGHRMRVEVQSSWFPLYDRNPQTFVPKIMTAPESAYKAQTISIYSTPKYPSHLVLPLAEASAMP